MKGETTNNAFFLSSLAAAAAVGAISTYLMQESKRNKKYQVPTPLLKSPYAKELQMALKVALKGT